MGSSFTCKLNPCCGDLRNCNPPRQYNEEPDQPIALQPSDSPALEAGVAEALREAMRQAMSSGWKYSINYGPDGEENYANLTTPEGQHVANIATHHAMAIVSGLNRSYPNDEKTALQETALDDLCRALNEERSAARDMLAALKQVEYEMRAGFGSSFGETREQVRRAISKAAALATPAKEDGK